ncbi:MAG: Mobile element protein [Hydrogenibacillus schlegelii]|uniref:Mobile element protein n=1 Tax=Hydrogenibacillus schlegelii TaxID=1484 RepID=A0A2T5GFB9_HYDSH|nr:MAG: Mobile element protein [Hydrogenibacillus schlegelii]
MKRTKSGFLKFKAASERIKGEKTLVERSRESGVHPCPLLKGKLPLLEKGAERSLPRTKRGSQKRIGDWVERLGKKEVEIVRLTNFLGQGSEINFRFRSASVWRKRRWPSGRLPGRFSSRRFAFPERRGMTGKSAGKPRRNEGSPNGHRPPLRVSPPSMSARKPPSIPIRAAPS